MKIIITEEQLKKILKIKSTLNESTLSAPVPYRGVNSPFQKKRCLRGQKCRPHNGTDYTANSGTDAFAIADGEVRKGKFAGGACGGTIIIKHDNGYRSSYCHMKRIDVSRGDRVKQGDVIGQTGGKKGEKGAGNSLGAHLHFGLKLNGKWVDPEKHINTEGVLKSNDKDSVNASIPEGALQLYDGMGKGRREMRGDVKQMQQDLITLNYVLPRFGVDGKFGRETLASVNAFQKDHGFVESETVTVEMLNSMKDPKNLNKNPEINDPKQVKKQAKQGNIKPFSPAVVDAIRKASSKNGVSEELMFTIANIESGGNPTARNKRSGASGLYQIMPKYFNDYGVNNTTVWDPYENADAGAKGLKRKIERLTKIIKSSPTNPQIYMAHNQGSRGFEIIYNACKNFGGLDGKESLQQSSNSLGYGRRTGSKIYRNMRGNKGNHPCQFMDSWVDIYNSKKTSYA